MIKVKNPNQLIIFDPWDLFTPKKRQITSAVCLGFFRELVMPSTPVNGDLLP